MKKVHPKKKFSWSVYEWNAVIRWCVQSIRGPLCLKAEGLKETATAVEASKEEVRGVQFGVEQTDVHCKTIVAGSTYTLSKQFTFASSRSTSTSRSAEPTNAHWMRIHVDFFDVGKHAFHLEIGFFCVHGFLRWLIIACPVKNRTQFVCLYLMKFFSTFFWIKHRRAEPAKRVEQKRWSPRWRTMLQQSWNGQHRNWKN